MEAQAFWAAWNTGDGPVSGLPTPELTLIRTPPPEKSGSENWGRPWARMQAAQLRKACCWAGVSDLATPWLGAYFLQAFWAEETWDWLAPNLLPSIRKPNPPPGIEMGSGQLGTPWVRMHWANFSAWAMVSPPAGPPDPGAAVVDVVAPRLATVGVVAPLQAAAVIARNPMTIAVPRAPLLTFTFTSEAGPPLMAAPERFMTGGRLHPGNGACYLAATPVRASLAAVRVLVVEDHQELAETVATGLRREGMAVDVALDGIAALDLTVATAYDVVILDRDLPRLSGDEVCRALTASGAPSRVLMLTAAGSVEERLDGFGAGADDYLPKPFAFAELVARIRALARRSGTAVPDVLAHADVRLDPARRLASRAGRRLTLSPKEFAVLELLLAADGRVVSAEELLERAWDEATDPFTSAVKVTVSRLRAKLGEPPLIETVTDAGYRLAPG